MGKVFGKLFTAVEKEKELPSNSEDIGVVAGGGKRKRTEDGESLPRKRSRKRDSSPQNDELLSSSEDIGVVDGGGKRKQTEDGESPPWKRSRKPGPFPWSGELFSSEDTESRNTPEAALSEGSAKRKAVDDEGPVEKKYRLLDESDVFKAKYQQLKKLGQGSFGCVFAGYRRADNLPVAIKHIDRKHHLTLYQEDDGYTIPMEVAVLEHLQANSERHSAPVDLLDWYVEEQGLILVLERPLPAVDLANYIQGKGGHLIETEAKIIINQLLDAAIDLKQKHIFHRDIKPENLLIETCMKSPRVRLIDFGLSCFDGDGDTYSNFYGSFVPPEWHRRQEYEAGPSTVYQIGVVLFAMLQGVASSGHLSFQKLKNSWWLSEYCKDFYKACMHVNPDQRFTLEQMRNHPWLR
ncbi:serine/threonine-protein kinase pim-1-like [Cyclopterus lumpus]|uniref:serine/threonine-protein kinase pim-1-like n=1 Tax=Cyclopterus lumpus TaxID=8103 RepID=UPI0014869084|nr:serine/threonine-protein kinase pim-1-like [Cyclopterus lumpus]XP_034404775.1 serine/threonine-protein kinase pim-1-like [Cyclopterus lumpus]XP_034404799.1 serine/threonine-protein kinase pim-1-like [Cyclopterus lumpus]